MSRRLKKQTDCVGKCPVPVDAANTQGLPHAGNINMPGWMSTDVWRVSHRILLGKGKPTIVHTRLNPFKRWAGAPGCSGKPLGNH